MKFTWLLLTAFLAISTNAEDISEFTKLKSLTGDWKREGSEGDEFYISFSTSANGSTLIENWIYKGKSHSLTVYHPDGESMIATHYCPQGNQPRLKLSNSSGENHIAFEFQDATNLASIEDSHQHSLSFEFINENAILRSESYLESGTETPSSMRLVRR